MDLFDAFLLGALQGITEFLPISSSGHLVLLEDFLGLNVEQLLSFDVIVHMGTLLAVFIYFWKDIWKMIKTIFNLFVGKLDMKDPYTKLILFIIIGSVPAVAAGLLLGDYITEVFRDTRSVAFMMLGLAIVFLFAEWVSKKKYQKIEGKKLNWWMALIIGCAQALALIPGISRSGSTIVAGLFQGVSRQDAARFSFLLGIPVILGAGLFTFMDIQSIDPTSQLVSNGSLMVGFLSSFVFGIASVSFLMAYLKKHTLMVFSIYLFGLSLFVLFQTSF